MVHASRRGLLLVEVHRVFADTSDNVDEVISPRFLYMIKRKLTNKTRYEETIMYFFVVIFNYTED